MINWKVLILLAWPVIFAIKHIIRSTIQEAWMLRHRSFRRRWFWKRFCDAMVSVLSLLVIMESVDTDKDQHWLLFFSKTAVESFVITRAIDDACHKTCFLFYRHIRLLEDILEHLFRAVLAWFLIRQLAYVILAFVAFWLFILVLEVVVDEVVALQHNSDRPPVITPFETRYWNLMSVLRSSNNGFLARQFRPIRIIDFNEYDDPFWPHASTIYMIEARRRNMLWRELTIWQVSLLNGGKKKIHTFNRIGQYTDRDPFSRRWSGTHRISGFQSNGVLMISHSSHPRPPLHLYDVRYGMSKDYILPLPVDQERIGKIVSISCFHRLFNPDGSISGWRIRIMCCFHTRCDCHEEERYRSLLYKNVYELREKARMISQDEIVFGQCLEFSKRIHRCVRTSRGHVGVYSEDRNIGDGPVMLYDPVVDQFAFLPNFDTLRQLDRPFALYNYTPSPTGAVQFGDENGDISPLVVTDQECVECVKEDIVFCTQFKAPSIKLRAATSLFKSIPNLRSEMSAEEFRAETGISGMQGHFDR